MQILTPFSAALGVYSDITSIRANSQRLQLDKDTAQLAKDRAALEAEKARAAGFQ
jgi:cell division protein FtsB